MPQSAKFNKDEIINAAVNIIEAKGIQFLTARSLGEKLGTSARPIFTTFNNMNDVLNGVFDFANNLYQKYVNEGLQEPIPFKGVGIAYIHFAIEHPKLFQFLFMRQHNDVPNLNNVLGLIEDSYQNILNSIIKSYHVNEEFAKELYQHMWIYTHGIAVLIVNKMCVFSGEEISNMLNTVCKSLIINGVKND